MILRALEESPEETTVQKICRMTGVRSEDVVSTLHSLNLIKYWKGQHVISISQQVIDSHALQSKKMRLCNPQCLVWEPPAEKQEKKSS